MGKTNIASNSNMFKERNFEPDCGNEHMLMFMNSEKIKNICMQSSLIARADFINIHIMHGKLCLITLFASGVVTLYLRVSSLYVLLYIVMKNHVIDIF